MKHEGRRDLPRRKADSLMLTTMNEEQMAAVIDALPMELCFIDHEDIVRFWNRNDQRGPAWQPSRLGLHVNDCHQPESHPGVMRVVEKLKSGEADVVDRIVSRNGLVNRFRWLAIRNGSGDYLGCLEIVQRGAEVAAPQAD